MVSALYSGLSGPVAAGDIVLCSWARHSLSLCFSLPPACKFNTGRGNPAMEEHTIQTGVEIFLFPSCYRPTDKLRTDELLGSYADFTYLIL